MGKVDLQRLASVAKVSAAVIGKVRESALAPSKSKKQPTFSTSELIKLIEKDENWLEYRLRTKEQPMPERQNGRYYYSLPDVQAWCKKERGAFLRPQDALGHVICVGNFKGGSAKTTTAATLAQGLSIRGHKCLVIDTDPQSSLSNLFGVIPDLETEEVKTILPVCTGQCSDVMQLVRPTYWSGIDLIAANKALSAANAILPTKEHYWALLRDALHQARKHYDAIIIDTSPSLDPLPVACLFASNALLVPVIPNALDFASSAQYWGLFTEVFSFLPQSEALAFDFVRVLLTRVDAQDRANIATVREMIRIASGELLLDTEIPKTSFASSATTVFSTAYDVPAVKMPRAVIAKAKEPYERFVSAIEWDMRQAWADQ